MTVSWLVAEVALLPSWFESLLASALTSNAAHHLNCPTPAGTRSSTLACKVAAWCFYVVYFTYFIVDFSKYIIHTEMVRTRLYATCQNPKCPGNWQGGCSWRFLDEGRPNCKFCNTKFDLSIFKVASKSPPKAQTQKPPKGAQDKEDPTDEQLVELLKRRFPEDQDKQAKIAELIPPKQKTPAEQRAQAQETHEGAAARHAHETKKLADMEVKYARLCGALLEYKDKLAEQRKKTEDAKNSKDEAERDLHEITAADSSPFPPNTAPNKRMADMAVELNKFLGHRLSALPPAQSHDILSTMASIIEKAASPPPPPSIGMSSGAGGDDDIWSGAAMYEFDAAQLAHNEEAAALALEAATGSMSMDDSSKRGLDACNNDDGDPGLDSDGSMGPRAIRKKPLPSAEQMRNAEALAQEGAAAPAVQGAAVQNSQAAASQSSASSAQPPNAGGPVIGRGKAKPRKAEGKRGGGQRS